MAARKTATAPKTRTRRPKAETAPAAVAAVTEMSPREKELSERYPHQNILPGSWRAVGAPDRKGLGDKKATVEVKCKMEGCNNTRIVCTSDLQWATTCYCLTGGCAKRIHANHRATAAQKRKLK